MTYTHDDRANALARAINRLAASSIGGRNHTTGLDALPFPLSPYDCGRGAPCRRRLPAIRPSGPIECARRRE